MMHKKNSSLAFFLSIGMLAVFSMSCGGKQVKDEKKEAHRLPPVAEKWRKTRPTPSKAAPVSLPTFKRATLKNGLTLLVVESPSLPIVDVRLAFKGGADQESSKKSGLASLTYDLLDEGAGKLDAIALSDAQQALGTRIHTGVGRESGNISMGILKRNLDEGMQLMNLIVTQPTFNKADFERIQKTHLAGLISKRGNPQSVAFELFAKSLFGEEHPYGRPTSGSDKSLNKLKVTDVKQFWKGAAGPKNAALILSGDITLDEAVSLAETHFGKWKSRTAKPKTAKDTSDSKTLSVKVVAIPGAAQTMILVGRPLLKNGDPDEVASVVFNQILGGMFTSRLNLNLREEHHYSYGAFSYIDARSAVGPFLAGSAIEAKHTTAALHEFLAEFEAMMAKPVTADELLAAQDNFVRSLPNQFETIGAMGNAAVKLFLYDLDDDYYQKLPELVAAVSVEDVQRVAKRACTKEGLHVVLVGPPAALQPIEALQLGDFEFVSLPK